jgi:hypothetical protein
MNRGCAQRAFARGTRLRTRTAYALATSEQRVIFDFQGSHIRIVPSREILVKRPEKNIFRGGGFGYFVFVGR